MPQLTPSALARTHPPGLTPFRTRRKGRGDPIPPAVFTGQGFLAVSSP